MSDGSLAMRYQLALLAGSETHCATLVHKFLRLLLEYSGFSSGLFLSRRRTENGLLYGRIEQVAGIATVTAPDNGRTLPSNTLNGTPLPAMPFDSDDEIRLLDLNLQPHALPAPFDCSTCLLLLPVGKHEAFILLGDQPGGGNPDPEITQVLDLLANALQRLRDQEEQSNALQEARNKQQQAERILNQVLDEVPAGVYWQDTQGNILHTNHWLKQDLGDISQQETAALLDPASFRMLQQDDALVLEQGYEIRSKNHYLHRRDDSYLWIELNKVPLHDEQGRITGLLGTYRDITGRKLMMEELLHAKEHAEQANRAKSAFLASMSHELRTPLNAIQGYAQLMELDDSQLSADQQESLSEIQRASQHLLQLIDEVLDLSKIEAGRIQLNLSALNPIAVIQDTLSLSRVQAEQNGITLTTDFSEHTQQNIFGDERRIKQILLNLLSNAIKYNRPQGTISVSTELIDNRFCVHIRDSGFGLTEDQIHRLFNPFERLGMENSARQGTGIGLTISQKLAQAMNGRISATSTPGSGCCFTLCLPMVEHLPLQPTEELSVQEIINRGGEKTSTLYVEDNRSNRLLVEKVFSKRPGDRLLTAATPEQGLEILRHELPDLVIIDINLPGMSGYDMLRHIQSEGLDKNRLLVALSGNNQARDFEEAHAAGFHAYMTKPINLPEFNRKLNLWLKSSKPATPEEEK